MKSVARIPLAVVAGVALLLALVVAVELFSAVVHKFPADFKGNIGQHVKGYPHWILSVFVLAWSATSTAATWIAPRIGDRLAGAAVAMLLGWALVFQLDTMWLKVVMFSAFPVACLIGIKCGARRTVTQFDKRDSIVPTTR